MKHIIPTLALVLAVGAFAIGCGPSPKATLTEDAGPELTATDLADLQDFHAWKLPIPLAQQPLKRVKLVLVGPDATSVELFGTAYSDPAPAWTNILLGFRYEGGAFVGRLHGRRPNGGEGYSFNFTNAATEHPRSWAGHSRFDGNRAELATFWKSAEARKSDSNDYSTLVAEIVK
jgi:hypothetical protein